MENQQAGELISMTYTWTIDNFSKLKTQKHYSDGFVVGDFKWRIVIYPKGSNGNQYLSMYLNVADASKLPSGWSRYAEFTLTVVNQFNSDKSITIDTQHQFSASKSDWGFTSFMPLSELCDQNEGYLVDDICIVEAEVAVSKADIKVLEDQETAFLEQELQSQSSDVHSMKLSEASTAHTSLCIEQMLAFQDYALSSDSAQTNNGDSAQVQKLSIALASQTSDHQVIAYQETDSPLGPPIVEEHEKDPSSPVGKLVDFRGLGKIDKAFVPLLEEVCLWHPSLISKDKWSHLDGSELGQNIFRLCILLRRETIIGTRSSLKLINRRLRQRISSNGACMELCLNIPLTVFSCRKRILVLHILPKTSDISSFTLG